MKESYVISKTIDLYQGNVERICKIRLVKLPEVMWYVNEILPFENGNFESKYHADKFSQ